MFDKMLSGLMRFLRKESEVYTISIGDIFLQQGEGITETQFIATSRYIDIKNYCSKISSDFTYKNTICKCFWGQKHCVDLGNGTFRRLINSFKKKGYDDLFPVLLNRKGYLIDGNHRSGACLYFKIDTLKAIVKRNG